MEPTTPDWYYYVSSIGSIASGAAIIILVLNYYLSKKNANLNSYSQKIERTFRYISRLHSFSTHFSNIFRYIEYRKNPTGKKLELNDPGTYALVEEPGSEYLARTNLIDVYLFLKEIDLLMTNVNSHQLVDTEVLVDAFEGFTIDINNFFRAAFEFVADKEIKFGKLHGFRGDINRKNLVELTSSFQRYFGFIE